MRPVSKLFLPPSTLAGAVFAGVYRDTRGAGLAGPDRANHFPASPLVSVTQVIHGELRMLQGTKARAPATLVLGPQDAPVSSWSPGDVTALSVGLYHDAWLRLGGATDFRQAPDALLQALEAFSSSDAPDAGWAAFCEVFAPAWARRRPPAWSGAESIADWSRAAMARAALSGTGRSLRSVERWLKRRSGQTCRSLAFYTTFEDLHRISVQADGASLADIAQDAGFADQSHMGRAVKRATGFSPARLNRAIATEEAFWCYRLLGERF